MNFVNRHLAQRYTNGNGTFVTAFYGILDPIGRELTYTSAGHPPPRVLRSAGDVQPIAVDAGGLPLGIDIEERYKDVSAHFGRGDLPLFYTDGITEARSEGGDLFETERLDAALLGCNGARRAVAQVTETLSKFCGGRAPGDDQTVIAARFE